MLAKRDSLWYNISIKGASVNRFLVGLALFFALMSAAFSAFASNSAKSTSQLPKPSAIPTVPGSLLSLSSMEIQMFPILTDGVMRYHLTLPTSKRESTSVSLTRNLLQEDLHAMLAESRHGATGSILLDHPSFDVTPLGIPSVVSEPTVISSGLTLVSF